MPINVVTSLIALGFTFIVVGAFWMLIDEGLVEPVINDYWVDSDYLDTMHFIWRVAPIAIFVAGLFIIVIGTKTRRAETNE